MEGGTLLVAAVLGDVVPHTVQDDLQNDHVHEVAAQAEEHEEAPDIAHGLALEQLQAQGPADEPLTETVSVQSAGGDETADALEDRVFSGYVETVSVIGTSSNGVTTYPVTVVINEPEGLIPGMNVSADIIVEKKENVVRIPASALMRGNQVAVKLKDGEKTPEIELPDGKEMPKNSKMMMNVAPEGFKLVRVKVGLSNEDYVEITEGVAEGDIVRVTASQTAPAITGFPGMSGMSHGMPAGIPGGGMPGGMPGGR